MFCPQCLCEYRAGITECADCGAALVESLPDSDPPGEIPGAPVTVFQSSDAALVALAHSVLESAEIPVSASSEGLITVRFDVAAEDAAEARELIKELEELEEASSGDVDSQDATEPESDSETPPDSNSPTS